MIRMQFQFLKISRIEMNFIYFDHEYNLKTYGGYFTARHTR